MLCVKLFTLSVLWQANVWNIDIARLYFKHVKSGRGCKVLGCEGGEGGRRHSTGGGRYGRRRGAATTFTYPTYYSPRCNTTSHVFTKILTHYTCPFILFKKFPPSGLGRFVFLKEFMCSHSCVVYNIHTCVSRYTNNWTKFNVVSPLL